MYAIARIENAIIGRLRDQIPYLRTCASLAYFLLKEIEDIALILPAAYVTYEQGDFEHSMSGAQDRRMVFSVLAMAGSMKGDEASRHGSGGGIGVYRLLDDVRVALTNQSCGLDIDPFRPITERSVDGDSHLSVYGISFETRCRFLL